MRRINSKWFQVGSVAAILALQAAFWAMASPEEQKEVMIENGKEATLTVTTTSGETYGFYGEFRILEDGSNGDMADLELTGWLVGYDDANETEEMAD